MERSVRAPEVPELPPELDPAAVAQLDHDAGYSELELVGAALQDQLARGVTFHDSKLMRVDLSGSRLEHLTLANCELDICNLANLQGRGASLRRVLGC